MIFVDILYCNLEEIDDKKTRAKNARVRLSINPRTAKTQFFQIIEIDLYVAFFISFGEPHIGSPKAFLLTSVKRERFVARRPDALWAFTDGILA